MKRFVLTTVLASLRQAIAVVVVLVALPAAVYLGTHRLSNPDNYQSLPSNGGPGCVYNLPQPNHGDPPPCSPPTRAAWQIPLAVVLGAVCLGAVLAGANERPRRRPLRGLSA
jgi:hypothetical protein